MTKKSPPKSTAKSTSTPRRYDDAPDLTTRIIRTIERLPRALLALVKSWQGVVILVIVATQLVLPFHYYTIRRDPHDERFAWRMFSPMRMTRCTPRFTLNNEPINLSTQFHEAWIEIAKRGRFVVIEQMAAEVCAKNPKSSVHVTVECNYLGRTEPETWGGYDMCVVPYLWGR